MNTLTISSEITLDIDKEMKPKNLLPYEDIETDSQPEMQVDINNNQLDEVLRRRLYEWDDTDNKDKSNKLIIDEFDIFIEMRINNDTDPIEFYDIFKDKYQAANNQNMLVDQNYNNDNQYGDNFDINDAPQLDAMSVRSDMQYSFENGAASNEVDYSEILPPKSFIPNDRYEVESVVSTFDTGGNGIFKETSFLSMETELTGSASIRDQINLMRTINRLKRIGDGSALVKTTQLSKK